MDPLSIARGGITAAAQRFEASAERTASDDPLVDYGHEVVEQVGSAAAFHASVNVVKVADEMMTALLQVQDVRGKK
jgi:flagellar hook protein FlgE